MTKVCGRTSALFSLGETYTCVMSHETKSKPKRSAKPSWMSQNLLTLSWVSLLQDAASEMLYPLLPILLNSVLGAPAAVVGMVEGAAEGAAALTKLASSWINRFVPRKLMVLGGYGAAAVGKLLVAAAAGWPAVLVGRVVDRLGKGVRSASRDAILLHTSSREHRGKVVGFHRMADTTGAVIGPLLALGLLAIFDNDVRPVLWFAVIPGVLSTLTVLLVKDRDDVWHGHRERRITKRAVRKIGVSNSADVSQVALNDPVSPAQGSKDVVNPGERLSPRARAAIALIVGFSLLNFPDALLLLHLSQIGISVTGVVGVYLLFNITSAALSFPAGMLSDRFKPNQIFGLGLILFAVAYGGMALTKDVNLSIVLFVIYGAYAAVQDTVGKSWVSKLAPETRQLWAQSLLQGFSGFGVLIAGLWSGLIWLASAGSLGSGAGTLALAISGGGAVLAAIVAFALDGSKRA
jgi:MFS family permease